MNPDIAVLLTATVDPGDGPYVVRRDPEVRYRDYKDALGAWIKEGLPCPVVFCENSGFDLTELRAMSGEVEFSSFREDPAARQFGKGFGELGIIAHALEHAKALKSARRILKITGRYQVRNARKLIGALQRHAAADICCDLRRNLSMGDSRAFCGSRRFLENYLLPRRTMIDAANEIYLEHILARAAHAAMADGLAWALLPVSPILIGVSGTSGRPIPDMPEQIAAQRVLRSVKSQVLAI